MILKKIPIKIVFNIIATINKCYKKEYEFEMMINKKAIFCIPVKNESKNLRNLFLILSKLTKLFKDYYIIFIVSDTTDNSINLINKFSKNKKVKIIIKNFKNYEKRLIKLEKSRNTYLNIIRKNKKLKLFDYMIPLDCGNVNNELNINVIKKILNTSKTWVALFPSQKYLYYDILALRIKNFIEFDCFDKIKIDLESKKTNLKKIFYKNLVQYFFLKKYFSSRYIPVISAFGGMGFYKLKKVIQFKYNSLNGTVSEHVEFHKSIYKKYGKNLFIDKNLINSSGINIHTINGLLCSLSSFFCKRFLRKIT